MCAPGEADINVVICLIINTADYCYETSGELAESMKKAVRGLRSDELADRYQPLRRG